MVWLVGTDISQSRAVGRSENWRKESINVVRLIFPLVEIGLTDLPKSGGAMARYPFCIYKFFFIMA